ncbi:hypothetical protein BRC88_08600 [Halobacteriales archaeon QS_4_69_225]|nr:MAG: hypothetical protein BRC88_08600 [Halobacteriales archaeon QS_4_69_225]
MPAVRPGSKETLRLHRRRRPGLEPDDGLAGLLGHAGRLARLVDGDVDQPALRNYLVRLVAALVVELDAGLADGVDADGVEQPVAELRRRAVIEVDVDD